MQMPLLKTLTIASILASTSSLVYGNSKELNVLNWSDYISPTTVDSFTQELKIAVKYDTLDSDDTLQAKLLTGNSGYDVVYPSSTFMAKQLRAGVYEKLDWSKLPNRVNLDPELMLKVAQQDPGNKYGVPYFWGTDGFVVNMTKAQAILGKNLPTQTWDLLYKPEWVSKLKSCGVSLVDSATDVFPTMLAYMGKNPNSKDPNDYKAAFNELKKIRPYITQFSSTYLNDVAGGDVCIAFAWSGDAGAIKSRVEETNRDYVIQYFAPRHQTGLWFTLMGIPKDAPNKESAYAWINYLMRPEVAADITNQTTYPMGITLAKPLIDQQILADTNIYPTSDMLKDYFVFEPIEPELLRLMNRLWVQFKSGR